MKTGTVGINEQLLIEYNGQMFTVQIDSMFIGNNGIGLYEFWGIKGYDAGTNYVEDFEAGKLLLENDDGTKQEITGLEKDNILEYATEDILRQLDEKLPEYDEV